MAALTAFIARPSPKAVPDPRIAVPLLDNTVLASFKSIFKCPF